MKAIAIIGAVACGFVLLIVANAAYKLRGCQWRGHPASIDGRTGLVVSNWPLDLRVTINVPMTEEEIESAFDPDAGWTREEWTEKRSNRTWITAWRWNAELHASETGTP